MRPKLNFAFCNIQRFFTDRITFVIRGRVKKSLQPSFFLFTWVHLYKGSSDYINYEPLSFMTCNMDSVARLVALRHQHKDNAFWALLIEPNWREI